MRYKRVNKLTNPTDQVEKGMKNAEPCTTVSARTTSEMYDVMYDVMYDKMYDKMNDKMYDVIHDKMYDEMRSTVFNRESRAVYNIYETAYSQQIHTYTNAME